jgi:hypothetical protein
MFSVMPTPQSYHFIGEPCEPAARISFFNLRTNLDKDKPTLSQWTKPSINVLVGDLSRNGWNSTLLIRFNLGHSSIRYTVSFILTCFPVERFLSDIMDRQCLWRRKKREQNWDCPRRSRTLRRASLNLKLLTRNQNFWGIDRMELWVWVSRGRWVLARFCAFEWARRFGPLKSCIYQALLVWP